ncbi:MAG: hypothetical protein AAGJ31_15130, partial [Verrucomicrobiota bacterium]
MIRLHFFPMTLPFNQEASMGDLRAKKALGHVVEVPQLSMLQIAALNDLSHEDTATYEEMLLVAEPWVGRNLQTVDAIAAPKPALHRIC